MKKFGMTILMIAVVMFGVVNVKALNEAGLKEKLFQEVKVGKGTYTLSDAQKVIVERYLNQNEISDADCALIWEKVEAALGIIKGQGNVNFTKYPQNVKDQLKALVNQITTGTNNRIKATLTKDGLTVQNSDGTKVLVDGPVKQTGSETSRTAIIAGISILIVAVGTCLVIKQVKTSE